MPAIRIGTQIFDIVFHPTLSITYIALLDGHIKAFAYNDHGNHKALFSLRPAKKSCRGLSLDQDGSHLFAVGKGRALRCVDYFIMVSQEWRILASSIDTKTEAIDIRKTAHECVLYFLQRNFLTKQDSSSAINRVKHLMPWLLATGDDDGVVKVGC